VRWTRNRTDAALLNYEERRRKISKHQKKKRKEKKKTQLPLEHRWLGPHPRAEWKNLTEIRGGMKGNDPRAI